MSTRNALHFKNYFKNFEILASNPRRFKIVIVFLLYPTSRPVEKEEKVSPQTTERYKLFEGVYEVSLRTFEGKLKPVVSWSHPPLGSHQDRTLLATESSIPDFCFPDIDSNKFEQNTKKMKCKFSETYAFVQTDMCASRRFGYCRRFKAKPEDQDPKGGYSCPYPLSNTTPPLTPSINTALIFKSQIDFS